MRILIAALMLSGCTTLPADPAKMSPEQLREWAKDRNASVTCVQARNATGTVAMISVSLDKAVISSGSVTVKPSSDCEATITASPKP